MQHTCKVLKNNWKRCFSTKEEAIGAATEIPQIVHVYKCPSCHWWHLTSHGRYRLPHWVREQQYAVIFQKQKYPDGLIKKNKKRADSMLTLEEQKLALSKLNNQPIRPCWKTILYKIRNYISS